ncbi:MAG TPA: DUF1343 domain-containing protein [Clostridia bacterium]|nr:DUF1343 domain-containing protein [Clostridia bacterium]
MAVCFGIDHALVQPGELPGRIGLVTNDAARTSGRAGLTSRLALQRAGVSVARLFSPEHGLHASAPDGQEVPNLVDPLTGLEVISLYGEKTRPNRADLAGLDAIVFDIPDIGVRFYTYLWTLFHLLEACADSNLPLVLLDRPNPLGGEPGWAEGPLLDVQQCGSFLGRAPIPIRHSLTFGELAGFLNDCARLNVSLKIIRCGGWHRAMHWPDTQLPFVPTSPAIRSYHSTLFYPGLCFFEATNLSVGRGTAIPFQAIGAPWLRAEAVCEQFNALGLEGVQAREDAFVPDQSLHAGQACGSVRLVAQAPKQLRPAAIGLHLLSIVTRLHPDEFHWTTYPTAANPTGVRHLDYLIGNGTVVQALRDSSLVSKAEIARWTDCGDWGRMTRPFWLYE